MKTKILPQNLKKYFWDVNLDQLDVVNDADFILKRVLEHGETQDIFWLKKNYSQEKFRHVFKTYRDFSRKTGLFWSALLNLNPDEVKCLQIPYRQTPYGV